jgi:hypothetical protein
MVKKSMVIELIEDGAKLLRELDRNGYPVEAMFWVDEPDDDRSRLVIASPDVISQSSMPGYQLIQKLLPALDLSGLELSDIYLAEPDSKRFQALLAFANNSNRINAGPTWFRKADAVVYRWSSAALRGQLNPPKSADELTAAWDTYRNSPGMNSLTLLIDANEGEFTLRVHPKHGIRTQAEIDQIKVPFKSALVRLGKPDVTWL